MAHSIGGEESSHRRIRERCKDGIVWNSPLDAYYEASWSAMGSRVVDGQDNINMRNCINCYSCLSTPKSCCDAARDRTATNSAILRHKNNEAIEALHLAIELHSRQTQEKHRTQL